MNTEMNRRQQTTLENLEAAFFAMMQNKDLKDISITELCERADINRSTFYTNYAYLASLASAYCRRIEKQVAELPHEDGDYTWLFEYVAGNRDAFSVYFKLAMPPEDSDYQLAFRRRGIYAVVKTWFEDRCGESAIHMGELLKGLIKS